MSQQTAKRRRSQAANGYKHLAPMDRPNYAKRSMEASRRHMEAVIAKERAIQQGKGKK